MLRKKVLATLLTMFMLIGGTICAHASCVTHVAKDDIPSNWELHRTISSFTGSVHPYTQVMGGNGETIKEGTCQIVIYARKYVLRCRNCSEIVDTRIKYEEEHQVKH